MKTISGATILGDATVALILDMLQLASLYQDTFPAADQQKTITDITPPEAYPSLGLDVSDALQLFIFKLDNEWFAFDIARVREVLQVYPITRVPGSAGYMRGLINVRGSVMPVMDLKAKIGFSGTASAGQKRIIILEFTNDNQTLTIGALVDSVKDVITLFPEQIKQISGFDLRWRKEFIKGIGMKDKNIIIILDSNRIFGMDNPS